MSTVMNGAIVLGGFQLSTAFSKLGFWSAKG